MLLAVLVAALAGPGLVVEEAAPGSPAARAGLRPGDVLLRWERAAVPPANAAAAGGVLASPFDADDVEIEQAPRGAVTLSGTRDGQPLVALLPHDDWRLVTRPALDPEVLAEYEAARALADGPDPDRGLDAWNALARRLRDAGDRPTATWLAWRAGRKAADRQRWAQADAAFAAAEAGGREGEDAALPQVLVARGIAAEDRSQWEDAARSYAGALALYQARAPGSLREARVHSAFAVLAFTREDVEAAETSARRALALREAAAPRSLPVSAVLNNLGAFAGLRGDLAASQAYLEQALAIRSERVPGGNLEAATLNNLGIVARRRGDLSGAEAYHRRAAAIEGELEPEGIGVAMNLHNLGVVAAQSGDPEAAARHFRHAVAIKSERAPGSPTLASSLDALGGALTAVGDLAAAEARHREALEIASALAPEGTTMASALHNLGVLALRRGNPADARTLLERALAIRQRTMPASTQVADVQVALGDVERAEGHLAAAEAWYRRALALQTEAAPGTTGEAEACERLASVARRQGRADEAAAHYARALDALDAQRRFLGAADQMHGRFQAKYAGFYRDAIGLLVERGRGEEAFAVLERYRARSLLALLAERDLVFAADVPEGLDRERRLANAAYDRALARLAQEGKDAAAARAALAEARRRQAEVAELVRAASPALFELQYPRPLDLAGARARLDPGTVLLSYVVGETESHVFAVGPGPQDFTVAPLRVTRAALAADVTRFRSLLRGGARLQEAALRRVSSRLGRLLLGPVAARVAAAERVLVLPDGPLHALPFAALGDPSRPGRFLLEARAVHLAASATTFAELGKRRRPGRAARLLAFGDPEFAAGPAGGTPLPVAPRVRGGALVPLPATRAEVAAVARLYPGAAEAYVGAEATEGRAKAADPAVTLIHFATHGLVDAVSPLDSALALSVPRAWKPGDDNGYLQAWEVFEQMRVDADLVTLSACDSALGEEISGEGMLGLTRAFQYAGARTVLASLWGVDDESTAELMTSFYTALRAGRAKDEALRAAQLRMLASPRWRHPRYWAAFELLGDWR